MVSLLVEVLGGVLDDRVVNLVSGRNGDERGVVETEVLRLVFVVEDGVAAWWHIKRRVAIEALELLLVDLTLIVRWLSGLSLLKLSK